MQGLGNVGYHAAKFCREGGAVMIAVIAEREGAIYNPKGLEREAVFQHRKETGSILDFPGATNLANSAAALELDCDILVPAALENRLTAENAPRIKAKIIVEGANGPTTPRGRARCFRQRGVLIIPDIYCQRRRRHGVLLRVAEEPVARALRPHGEALRAGATS